MTLNPQTQRPGSFPPRFSPSNPSPSLPQGYLANGYFDNNGDILDEVIIQWPQALARAFHESRPQLKTAQLRKFFGEVRRQEARLASGVPFTTVRTEVQKLDSHAENAYKKNNAPFMFRVFMDKNVKLAARDEKSFKAFTNHFESIVGYYPETK
jgi:CRISPR type III-A-associated protein Csm2